MVNKKKVKEMQRELNKLNNQLSHVAGLIIDCKDATKEKQLKREYDEGLKRHDALFSQYKELTKEEN